MCVPGTGVAPVTGTALPSGFVQLTRRLALGDGASLVRTTRQGLWMVTPLEGS